MHKPNQPLISTPTAKHKQDTLLKSMWKSGGKKCEENNQKYTPAPFMEYNNLCIHIKFNDPQARLLLSE